MAAVRTLFVSLLLLSFTTSSLSGPEDDALLKFKESLTNAGALDSWEPNSQACNGWAGVVCFNGIITGLHLSDMGLSGKIDISALESVRGLRTISFVNNSFSGQIPEFNQLGALKSLLLTRNQFSGEIPIDFFLRMQSIKKVWLSENKFSGNIPASLAQLLNLMELHLEGNQFSGQIPSIKADKLVSVDFSRNKLTGPIPASLSKFGANSFAENDGLCGKQVGKECSNVENPMAVAIPQEAQTAPSQSSSGSKGGSSVFGTIVWIVGGILVVGIVLIVLFSSRRRDDDFRVLEKEKMHEAGQVNMPVPKSESSTKKGSVSKKGSQNGKGSTADLVIVNDQRGTFGLADLMKASAEVLGNGSLGSAYKAVMANGVSVVVKRMREMNAFTKEGFDAEMRRFGKIRHPNILTPLAYHYRREEKLLVSEYIPKGSLLYLLHGDRGICHAELNWPIRFKIILGVAHGLGFLHSEFSSHDLPHGNLKSSNVLLSDNYEPLLSDYALHPLMSSPQAAQAMFAYRAPESSQGVSLKCDIYCLGIIILEILTGKFPSQYISNGKGGTDVVQWVQSAISEQREEEIIDPAIMTSRDSVSQMVRLLHIGASCTESNAEDRVDLREAIRSIEELQV
ncbi:pollen receptor-like kinase 3 [Punica granatum]|uniref:Protein kinase domain-containing protein n=2 Tax=Punica granatum TaxID=22663 RepID=A0A218WXF3_PUNGR|nr:pollen receptor-like kinase 3 [Punica granatum]OWM77333.1 hypothetical protein CDL15_Pgr028970 [Punica granatum]PKI43510.1 hypothetical protein CRG98_036112 [Punica granatum]